LNVEQTREKSGSSFFRLLPLMVSFVLLSPLRRVSTGDWFVVLLLLREEAHTREQRNTPRRKNMSMLCVDGRHDELCSTTIDNNTT
jgi:hypothetical protein